MKRKYILFCAGFLMVLNIFVWQEVFVLDSPHYLSVGFLNVGQGDSAFIETPGGHQILIDGGPDSTVLAKLANKMPFWDKSLDLVILTHPERDHMTGILDVLQRYHVDYFLWTGVVKNDAGNKNLASLLEKVSIPRRSFLASLFGQRPTKILIAESGEEIRAGDVLIDILYPFENLQGQEIKSSANNTGVVSKVIYGKDSFLFTGDISSIAEKELIDFGEDLASNVLKIAHHGSKYSTSELFLQAVGPELAIIEVGKNSYGHPAPEVLQRLEKFGIKVLRTDKDGDVEILSDGKNMVVN